MTHEELLEAYSKLVPLAKSPLRKRMQQNGVVFVDMASVYISQKSSETEINIGCGTVIFPNVFLIGPIDIGDKCIIGPGLILCDVRTGDEVQIGARPSIMESELRRRVRVGRSTEIVRSHIGLESSVQHFSYVGDAKISPGVNIGAGVVIANYDGRNKSTTRIGSGAFIGSNSTLVAPVIVGKESFVGAGAVVRKNVQPNSVVVGVDRVLQGRVSVREGKNWKIIKE